MTKWAYVENDEIKGVYENLPTSWKNISGLNHLKDDVDYLKSLGWHLIVKSTETFDTANFSETGSTYSYNNGTVSEHLILTKKEINSNIDDTINLIRVERDRLLSISDIYQLTDWQAAFSEKLKLDWLIYRNKLRNIPQIYIDTGSLNWPDIEILLLESKESMNAYLNSIVPTEVI